MADKSAGQWVGTIVGAVIGYFNPGLGVAAGAALGAFAGGLIDPPKGPNIKGPRLEDLTVQNAQFGAPLARIRGTVAVMGTVIWVENNAIREQIRKKKQGGKGGGGGSTTTTYTYYGTFAVAFADAPPEGISAIRRVWVGSDLIYNNGSTNLETIIASNKAGAFNSSVFEAVSAINQNSGRFVFYSGSDDQMPDPRIEAEMGAGSAPAFRGTAYIVFYDFPLAKYSNSLMGAQVKVELVSEAEDSGPQLLSRVLIDDLGDGHDGGTITVFSHYLSSSGADIYSPQWDNNWLNNTNRVFRNTLDDVRPVSNYTSSFPENAPDQGISDSDVVCVYPVESLSFRPNGGSSYFIFKNGIYYRISANQEELAVADGVGSEILISVPDILCFAVDDDGLVYAVKDEEIIVYDESLTLIDSIAHGATISGANNIRAMFYNGSLYIFSDGAFTDVVVFSDGFASFSNYSIPTTGMTGTIGGVAVAISDGLVIRLVEDVAGNRAYIDRWRLQDLSVNTTPLSEVVEAELLRSEIIDSGDIDVSDLASDSVRGYAIAGVQQVRQCLAPLQAAWPFDVIQSGYQLKAVRRGNASVATILIDELDARAYGDEIGAQFSQSREMDSQLPRQIMVRHLDPSREYGPNQQLSAERQSSNSVDVRDIDIPLVLTPDEAAQIADVLHASAWTERVPATFKLPPTYLHLEPSDVVTVVADYGSFELRMAEINYTPDGRLECQASPNAAAAYTSPAVGGDGPTPDGEIPLSLAPDMALLDLPLIRNEDDEPGFAAAMAGTTPGWLGGQLLRSNDGEQTWTDVQAWSTPATMGYGRDPLPAHDGLVIDRSNSLTVDLTAGELSAITEAQMMTGLNWFAYGADGRWELGRFSGHTLNADGSSTISTLLRGLRGSEWATGLHEVGDAFILLDDPDTMVIGADVTALGTVRQWRGISSGQTVNEVGSIDFAYRGINLKPLSPVSAVGQLSGLDLLISFSPRTRLSGSLWKTGVSLPIGEASELYELDVFDGADVLRTIQSASPLVTYSYDDIVSDFGGLPESINFRIYQISATVGRGYPLIGSAVFAIPGETVFLLHMDGSNGSTTFTDSSTNAISCTAFGNAQISTAQSVSSGTSAVFDGAGDYVATGSSADFNFDDDFTIELFVRPSAYASGGSYATFVGRWVSAAYPLLFGIDDGGILRLFANGSLRLSGSVALDINAWQHIAVSRDGGTVRLFVDGILQASVAYSSAVDCSSGLYIGISDGASHPFNGYIDELRIRSGALYTSDFTPPTPPLL